MSYIQDNTEIHFHTIVKISPDDDTAAVKRIVDEVTAYIKGVAEGLSNDNSVVKVDLLTNVNFNNNTFLHRPPLSTPDHTPSIDNPIDTP